MLETLKFLKLTLGVFATWRPGRDQIIFEGKWIRFRHRRHPRRPMIRPIPFCDAAVFLDFVTNVLDATGARGIVPSPLAGAASGCEIGKPSTNRCRRDGDAYEFGLKQVGLASLERQTIVPSEVSVYEVVPNWSEPSAPHPTSIALVQVRTRIISTLPSSYRELKTMQHG